MSSSLTQLSVAVKQVSKKQLSVADGELYVEILDAKMRLSVLGDVFSVQRAVRLYVTCKQKHHHIIKKSLVSYETLRSIASSLDPVLC
jgi:hypothetical protein